MLEATATPTTTATTTTTAASAATASAERRGSEPSLAYSVDRLAERRKSLGGGSIEVRRKSQSQGSLAPVAVVEKIPRLATPKKDSFATGNVELRISEAAREGHVDALRELVEEWAGNETVINWQNPIEGMLTPLMLASHGAHEECVRLLIAGGAQVGCKSETGDVALHEAAFVGSIAICKLLIDEDEDKAVLHLGNKNGMTPTHWAAHNGHASVVTLLLLAGADVNAPPNHEGKTCLALARDGNHAEVVAILTASGGL